MLAAFVLGDNHTRISKGRGYPCAQNRVGSPKCAHTQMVATAIWASTGSGEHWVEGARSLPDAEKEDAEDQGPDKVATEVAVKPDWCQQAYCKAYS